MQFQQVHITITKDGQVEIKVEGAVGLSCLDITKALEAVLGGEVVSREMTAEAYQSETLSDSTRIFGA
ncbi:MAG: DUF2997 domain-containing protein [Candidatus Obscuribacterales bacterium]|nr:DUF2997 domain-containing protein [Candidatus Obscuribacterales bacterium]